SPNGRHGEQALLLDTESFAEYCPHGTIPGCPFPKKSNCHSPKTNISAPSGPPPPRRNHDASKFLEVCARTYTHCRRRAFSRSRPRPGDGRERKGAGVHLRF